MTTDRLRVLAWQVLILVVVLVGWQYLTGIKAISKTPGLYWIDPFFISRPSAIAERFVYLMSPRVRLTIWQMALSTVQSTIWGFLAGVSTGFVAGLVLGRSDRPARVFQPYIVAFNSLPRIALVPLITMIFGFGLLAKIVLAWSIVFFIVFVVSSALRAALGRGLGAAMPARRLASRLPHGSDSDRHAFRRQSN